jgi:cell division protein ZapA
MSEESQQVDISLLGHDYQVACPPGQQGKRIEASQLLDARMREIQGSGKLIGSEKIAIMSALNFAYDVLFSPTSKSYDLQDAKRRIVNMEKQLDSCFFEQDSLF